MEETQKEANRQRIKDEVLMELAKFLNARNSKPGHRFPILDRPIILTLIGTVILTLFTTYWGAMQHRYDLKLELLRILPTACEKTGNIVNFWLVHMLSVASLQNKPATEERKKVISSLSKKIDDLSCEYIKADDVDGILSKVSVVYTTPRVRKKAGEMKAKLQSLEQLIAETESGYKEQSLSEEKIKAIQTQRKKIVGELNELKNQLLEGMADELS